MTLSATAYADGGGNKQRSLGGPIFDITHVDVIPATVNGLDFPQTRRRAPQASAIRVILRPALIASSRQRCNTASSRSGLGSNFLRG
jgi:hypothetical protein